MSPEVETLAPSATATVLGSHAPQAADATAEPRPASASDTLEIHRRLDELSQLLAGEVAAAGDSRAEAPLSLANYRRGVARMVDVAMAETQSWWD